ncbi:TIR domain-containing protein [Sphingomonas sp. NSE70-1]|uniref:TIR domain-containing protein n=1 Tax=Sphingomonas caseinilyticus TaxID=2908205 RepID=A0ABT0RW89_9SPHN|nr:TIR domain-containing protein [Sphingomonas caseinilyticus]MCL6699268.1 TIR domain-containing protein [Sphingomonas caseinilyticus]
MQNEPSEPSDSKRATLFLSYSHADDAKARRIATLLEEAGYTVWWDALIEGGAAYARSIGSALETADAVIVMWSANSVESDWVRDEAALGRDRQCLIPISLDGARPPLGFRQYQVIKFRSWRGRRDSPQFEALERAISSCSGAPAPAVRTRQRGVSRRAALIGGAGAAAAIVGGGAYLAIDRGLFGGKADESSIAVLPFKNLSGDSSQEYFAEGLTEEIRAALIQLDELRVMAAASSERAGEDEDDLQAVAKKLGVGYLLGGSVRKSGDLFRISTELTDGKTGFSMWSTTVDRRLNDILALQGEIAHMVAEALSIQIATDEPVPGGTKNAEAYDHYLQGKSLYHLAKDEESDRQALANYDVAIAADPDFAMAHAARSRVLASIAAEYGKANELKPLYAESTAAARRAVELAPNLADAQLALGFVLFTGHLDVKGARPSYERAYQLGRGNADIILLYALYCSRAGLPDQAHAAIERALVLDPLNARVHRAAGSIDYAARLYADALPPLHRALELNPKISNAHAFLGYCLMQLGKLKEARAEFDAEPTNFFRLSGLAIVDHKLGDKAEADKAMADLVKEMGDASLYQQAQVLAQWGSADEAVARLERARQVGDSGLIYLATDPLLDPIRKHVGFSKLIRELNLN